MVVNSLMFKADEQHLSISILNLFAFWPIVVVIGSRLLCVSMIWSIIVEASIEFIKINQLTIHSKTGINLTNKSIGSKNEFEATLAKSELLHLLHMNKDLKSTLFQVSGTPKQPKMWNEIVGTTIANVDAFIDKRLSKPKVAAGEEGQSKTLIADSTQPDTVTANVQSHDIDVKIWSDNRRRIIGSSLITSEAKKSYTAEQVEEKKTEEKKKENAKNGSKKSLTEKMKNIGADVSIAVLKTGKKIHKEFDSLLGIDVYDQVPNQMKRGTGSDYSSLYS